VSSETVSTLWIAVERPDIVADCVRETLAVVATTSAIRLMPSSIVPSAWVASAAT
jgi:hypothetical protein